MRPRWLIVGLVASLALNLFLVGAGGVLVAMGMRLAHEGARPSFFGRASEQMSEPYRTNFRHFVFGVHGEVQPQLDQSRAMRVRAWTDLAAPEPDAADMKALLAQSRAADIAVRTRVEEAIVDQALGLPQPERAKLVEGVRRALQARAGGHPRP